MKNKLILFSVLLNIFLLGILYITRSERNQTNVINTLTSISQKLTGEFNQSFESMETIDFGDEIRNTSMGEELSRQIFENIYGKKFHPAKPDFLINPYTKRRMELDGYNKELKIAFEYNGKQHSEPSDFGNHGNTTTKYKDFTAQVFRDNLKKDLCKKEGIALITIPHTVKPYNMKKFIIIELKKLER